MQISGIKRLKDLDLIRIEAPQKLKSLQKGDL